MLDSYRTGNGFPRGQSYGEILRAANAEERALAQLDGHVSGLIPPADAEGNDLAPIEREVRPLGPELSPYRDQALNDDVWTVLLDKREARITNATLQFSMTTDRGVLGLGDGGNWVDNAGNGLSLGYDEFGLG